MTFLDKFRVMMVKGYDPDKPVTVEWWSGRQQADIQKVLETEDARELIGAGVGESRSGAKNRD